MKSESFDSFRRHALRSAFEKYREQLAKCRLGFVEESVHDLRVSIRRFLAAVDLFNSIHPLRYFEAVRRDMKRKLKAFNSLRDAHVMLIKVKAAIYQFPMLQVYYHELVSREQLLALQLKNEVENFDDNYVADVLFLIDMYFNSAGSLSFTQEETRGALQSARELFLAKLSKADPQDGSTIHKARIAFKRFRYMAEAMSGEFQLTKESRKRMNEYQTVMGEIQDSEVMLRDFKKFIRKAPKEYRKTLKDAKKWFKAERERLIARFFEEKEGIPLELTTFV